MEDGNRKVEEEIDTKIMVSNVHSVINCIIQLMSVTPNMESKYGFPTWYKRKDERIEKVVNNGVMEQSGKIEEVDQPIPVDIWGPFHIASVNGHRFFLTIVDDHSRFTWFFFYEN